MNNITDPKSDEIEKTDLVDDLLNQASAEENLEKIPELITRAIEINSSPEPIEEDDSIS
jgi:hypothetical protein